MQPETLTQMDADRFPAQQIAALSVVDSKPMDDGDVWVQLASTFTGFGKSDYAKVRVLDKFGTEVKVFPLFSCVGDGVIGQGLHPRKYADPREEAVYEVTFYNVYGASAPKYLKAGVTSDTMPALEAIREFL